LPIIMSTGMSSMAETAHAVSTARLHGVGHVALLHCVSSYPTAHDSQNLKVIQTLARMFDVPVGLSDHAADTAAIPVAVTLGASIYERHLMLPGCDSVDAAVSSTPDEFKALIDLAEKTQTSLGHGRRECLPAEAGNVTASRRSLHAVRALSAGDLVTASDITALRPSSGVPASALDDLVGALITRAIAAGERFRDGDLRAGGRREVA
jgi:sialic acid synthase SpsE